MTHISSFMFKVPGLRDENGDKVYPVDYDGLKKLAEKHPHLYEQDVIVIDKVNEKTDRDVSVGIALLKYG
jgi:hypothetical protein